MSKAVLQRTESVRHIPLHILAGFKSSPEDRVAFLYARQCVRKFYMDTRWPEGRGPAIKTDSWFEDVTHPAWETFENFEHACRTDKEYDQRMYGDLSFGPHLYFACKSVLLSGDQL
jgi:hypothetical protein